MANFTDKGVTVIVNDQSALTGTARQKTKFIVQAITERGVPNVPYEVNSELEFNRKLGRAISNSGYEILRGLKTNDATFVVFPVHHFTTGVPQGTKAEIDLAGATAAKALAKTTGAGYNSVVVAITNALSGASGLVDITVSIPNLVTQTVINVATTLTAEKVTELNEFFDLVDFDIADGALISVGSYTLAGGAKDVSTVVSQDFIDGVSSFANVKVEVNKLMNIVSTDQDVSQEYITFAENNLAVCYVFAPNGLSKEDLIDYRNGEGDYSIKFDSQFARLVAGGLKVKHPYNDSTIELFGAGDLAAAIARKDLVGLWRATADPEFGVFKNIRDVVTNFTGADYADLYAIGINLITNTKGTVKYDGNNSLFTNRTSSLHKENISELVVFMRREMFKLLSQFKFKPNTQISIWEPVYRRAREFFENLVNNQAIYGGEGTGTGQWQWIGDQDARTLNDLTYNTPTDIASGKYRTMARFTPVSPAEELEITLTIESGVVIVS